MVGIPNLLYPKEELFDSVMIVPWFSGHTTWGLAITTSGRILLDQASNLLAGNKGTKMCNCGQPNQPYLLHSRTLGNSLVTKVACSTSVLSMLNRHGERLLVFGDDYLLCFSKLADASAFLPVSWPSFLLVELEIMAYSLAGHNDHGSLHGLRTDHGATPRESRGLGLGFSRSCGINTAGVLSFCSSWSCLSLVEIWFSMFSGEWVGKSKGLKGRNVFWWSRGAPVSPLNSQNPWEPKKLMSLAVPQGWNSLVEV